MVFLGDGGSGTTVLDAVTVPSRVELESELESSDL
jgi:hypothetical protein